MTDPTAVLTAFREELIEADLVRRPSAAGARPPMHVEPIEGAVGPGDREGVEDDAELVVSIFAGGDLAEADGYDAATRRRTTIDVRYRSASSSALRRAFALDAAIRGRLIRPETNYGYGFELGSAAPVWAQAVGVWGGLGPLGRGKGVGFDHVAKYLVEVAP